MSRIVTVILMYHRHKPVYRFNLLGSKQRNIMFPVRYERYALCVSNT
jgi:hypothetical protein